MAFKFINVPILYEILEDVQSEEFDLGLISRVANHRLPVKKFVGLCNIAGGTTEFVIAHDNLRETVHASISGSFNRQRQLVCALSMVLFDQPCATVEEIAVYINKNALRLYTAEANGALYEHLKLFIRPELFFCSEYLGPQYHSGDVVDGVLHQDLQQTSFDNATFDIILTSEVLEHVPDAPRAEHEIIRILKVGGIYCFTVPFMLRARHDDVRAVTDIRGEIKYMSEPQFHSDPLRSEDMLVYRIFSYIDLKSRFSELGCQFTTYRFWSQALGILGDGAYVHAVAKNNSPG